jgi:signal transduction histidine kinase
VDLSFGLIHDGEGQAREAAVILVDITARKAGEEEVRALNAELEQRVERRTLELQEANRELEAFSYSVSHDLRAPLRHLDGFAGLLERHLKESLDEKGRHYLGRIGQAARSMGTLIDDLLDFSRVSRQDLRREPVDLDEMARLLLNECPPEVVRSAEPLGQVEGDPAMLRQALRNLISNAVKFSRHAAPPTLRLCRIASAPDELVLCVEDNGVGFDMTYRDKLFGVFQRLHSESQFEGTGIGLAIVARVAHRHGGTVWAESTPGEGARFFLRLPATQEALA